MKGWIILAVVLVILVYFLYDFFTNSYLAMPIKWMFKKNLPSINTESKKE